MKLFRRKEENNDLKKLEAGRRILAEKTTESFNDDEWEQINLIELYIFWAAFNAACYISMKDNPSKSILVDFGGSSLDIITEKIFIERNPESDEEEINKFYQMVSDVYSRRVTEYIELINIEMKKPRGTSSLVDLTCGILSHLFETKKNEQENYDPLFAMIIMNHMSALKKLINY